MLKKLLLSTLLVFSLNASQEETVENNASVEMSNYALGVIYSSGLGSGLLHRIYFADDYYVQNAGILGGYKDEYESTVYFNYGISVAKYLHSSNDSAFHVRTMLGAEFEYSEDSYYYGDYKNTNYDKSAIIDVGLGFELGSRESGNLMLALDMMYAFVYEGREKYAFRPSLGISALYNW